VNQQTEDSRIHLVLLDELLLFRTSLGQFLASQPGFDVTGDCGDANEAMEILRTSPVDVVLLELHFGGKPAEAFIAAARGAGYGGRFLIVTGAAGARESAAAIKSGASGIFLKSDSTGRLMQAIRLVTAGAVWIDPKVIRQMADRLFDLGLQSEDGHALVLTDRERVVLRGIVEGLGNRKIGLNLGLSESAVKGSVQQLFQRAGVRTRSQLVRAAFEGRLNPSHGETRRTAALPAALSA
jgi:two-component system, NarL family, nitrate/nitrite response regulator NarL